MMSAFRLLLCAGLLGVLLFSAGCHFNPRSTKGLVDIPRISKDTLRAKINDPSVQVVDVRYKQNWLRSDRKIFGASREEPTEIDAWLHKYPRAQMIVLYCD
jgi:hypothetical protein